MIAKIIIKIQITKRMDDFLLAESISERRRTQAMVFHMLTRGLSFVLPYMQTWVDNETWRAPVRLDIVIEDEPTEAATQVRAGCDFGITIF